MIRNFDCAAPDLRFGAVVGIWTALLLGAVNIRVFHNDNIPNVLIAVSLAADGDLELSEFAGVLAEAPPGERYWAVRSTAGIYSKYPVWSGVLAAPLLAPLVWQDSRLDDDKFWLGCGRLLALGWSAVFAGALACTLRRRVNGWWAVFLTLSAVLGTSLWHHLGSHLTNQVVPNVCIALILLILLDIRMTSIRALAVGVLAGLCVSARLPAAFAAGVPLGIFLTRHGWRRFIPLVVAGALVFPSLTMIYNAHAFGGALTTGYSYYDKDAFTANFFEGAAGLLISPTCGLFFYSPFLIAGVWAGWRCLRRRVPHDCADLGAWIFLSIIGQWLLFASWWCWNGALTFGCRMLLETVPGLVVLIALCLPAILLRPMWRGIVIIGGAAAMAHHLVGTIAYDAVAPGNPLKSDWTWADDFIALYIARFGAGDLLLEALRAAALLAALFVVAAYLGCLFYAPAAESSAAGLDQQGTGVPG